MSTAREIILRYGWNSTAYQILNPGMEHWFAPGHPGVVGFVRRRSAWVVAGAPVCPPELLAATVGAFEDVAGRRRVCYVCAAERLAEHLRLSARHATIAIGAQPVWDPAHWPAIVAGRSSLRAQLHRAMNKQVSVQLWNGKGDVGPEALGELEEQWLAARPLPAMGFLVESPVVGGAACDRRVWVAMRGGVAVAYLVASPVPLRNGWLLEQIVRSPAAPNGTAELLIDAAMRHLAADGRTYVTMGLVALSTHAREAMRENPLWVRALTAWARAHGRRFYHFDGLERFRAKMSPGGWETIYAIANEPRFTAGTLWSMAAAFARGSPLRTLGRALAKGAQTEMRWLVRGAPPAEQK